MSYDHLAPKFQAFVLSLSFENVSENFYEAVQKSESRLAIREELDALKKNGTWEITELPPNKKAVGCKWVFTIKYNPDGTVSRYNAKLMAKGFTQIHGIDYQKTFAAVSKLNTIKI